VKTITTNSYPTTPQLQPSGISHSPACSSGGQSISTNALPTNRIPVACGKLDGSGYVETRFTIPDSSKSERLHKLLVTPLQYDFPRYSRKIKDRDKFSSFQHVLLNSQMLKALGMPTNVPP